MVLVGIFCDISAWCRLLVSSYTEEKLVLYYPLRATDDECVRRNHIACFFPFVSVGYAYSQKICILCPVQRRDSASCLLDKNLLCIKTNSAAQRQLRPFSQ